MASHTPLEVKFAELEKAEQMHQNSRPKIQRVAAYLRNRKNIDKQYSPKLLSIGPIHHDNPNLKLGENYKLTWAVKYIQSTQHTREYLHQKIADNINELKGLYTDDVLALANTAASLKDFHSLEEKLSWLLFVDGCSLLYILEKLRLSQTDKPKNENPADQHDKQKDRNTNADQIGEQEHASINVDDKTDDKVDDEAEGHLNIKVDQLVLVMMDVLLLENQLPYRVLNLLWKNDDENLIDTMKDFLKNYHWTPPDKKTWRFPDKLLPDKLKDAIKTKQKPAVDNKTTGRSPPTHLLDLQRKIILKIEDKNEADKMEKQNQSGIYSDEMMKYRNIQDLKTVGITLKLSKTQNPTDVNFSKSWFCARAKLTLPKIVVDDTTEVSFLNLIAYEMCPDFKNNYGICSYVVFMDLLIDHPEDVKELRSKGILLNSLGSDEEVSELFNVISTDLVHNQETYHEVKAKILRHYSNRCNVWITQGYHTYFGNPWAITGFVAALIALGLTCAQTWYSIFPRGD